MPYGGDRGLCAVLYRHHDISIEPAKREVSRSGAPLAVEPKVFDLLVHLVENRERVVTKDELVEAVWQGRAISDATLSSAVKSARRILGDDGRTQSAIRTHHGRGFRFVGAIETTTEGERAASPAVAGSQPGDPAGIADIDLSLPDGPSLAVLRFTCQGGAPERLLADALANDIAVGLARTRWLFVSSRASAARFDPRAGDPAGIAARLGVRYLLRGTLRAAADRFRLTIALSDAVEGQELWAERYDRPFDDLFEVQDEVSNLVIGAVEFEVDLRERRRAMLLPIASLDAWSAYHQANDLLFRYSPDRFERAENLLNLAARLDPASSRVHAALSFLSWQRAFLGPAEGRADNVLRAADHAQHSLSLDPLNPQGHWALGRAGILNGDFDLAVEHLTAAIDLNPNFAHAQYSLGYSLLLTDRSVEGIGSVERARRISPYDPLSFAFMAAKAQMHLFFGEREAAVTWARRAARQPNAPPHVHAIAAWVHEAAGRHEDGLRYVAQVRRERPGYSATDFFRAIPFTGAHRERVAAAFARLGL